MTLDDKRQINLTKPQQNTTKREPYAYFMGCTVYTVYRTQMTLQWRHKEHDGVSSHQRLDCLLNRLYRRRSKKPSKLRVTGLCEGNSPVTGEFSVQRANNAENVSIWWRHRGTAISHIAKTLGSMSIKYRADTFASARYLIDIESRVFALWDCIHHGKWEMQTMARLWTHKRHCISLATKE